MRMIDLKHPTQEYCLSGPCALCLGHFDGVHLGHRALIEACKAENQTRVNSLPLGALCFSAPPKDYFSKTPTPQITLLDKKLELLRRAGLEFAVVYDFPEIRELDAFDFAKDILIKRLDCRLLVCGYNYTFGKDAAGTPETLLRTFGAQPGRVVLVVPEFCEGGLSVSSTAIRTLLSQGKPETAASLLGRAYSIAGVVQRGNRLGNTWEVPTANILFPDRQLIPRFGVYATTIRIGKKIYCGVSNVGVRPTVSAKNPVNCETFVFDFHGDLYGREIEVSFVRFLRPETKFESFDALKAQLEKDIRNAKAHFGCE